MLKIVKLIIISQIFLLTGCAVEPELSKKATASGKVECMLKGIKVTKAPFMDFAFLNLKRSPNDITAWLMYRTNEGDIREPIKEPSVMLKIFNRKELLPKKYQLTGFKHKLLDYEYALYRQKSDQEDVENGVAYPDDGYRINPKDTSETAKLIWTNDKLSYHDLMRGVEGRIAISFVMSNEILNEMLNAEKIELLIQTQVEPIIITITSEQLLKVQEFKDACIDS